MSSLPIVFLFVILAFGASARAQGAFADLLSADTEPAWPQVEHSAPSDGFTRRPRSMDCLIGRRSPYAGPPVLWTLRQTRFQFKGWQRTSLNAKGTTAPRRSKYVASFNLYLAQSNLAGRPPALGLYRSKSVELDKGRRRVEPGVWRKSAGALMSGKRDGG